MSSFLYLSQEDVAACGGLDMGRAVEDVEEAFRLYAEGDVILPSKTVLRWGDAASEKTRGRINAMPSYLGGKFKMAGIKWISSIPSNPLKRGIPRAHGVIILTDPENGVPVAIMDGTLVSAMRTGAASGVAAKYLAPKGAESVGIIGTGVQGRTQLMALLKAVPSIRRAKAFDLNAARAQEFAADMSSSLGITVTVSKSAQEACDQADIVDTVTTSSSPIVHGDWLKPGSLYVQAGGNECDDAAILAADYVVADSTVEVLHRGIHTVVLMMQRGAVGEDRIDAELGDVVAGKAPGRTNSGQTIVFCSVGMSIEDLAVATRVYRQAIQDGVGQQLTLWQKPMWV